MRLLQLIAKPIVAQCSRLKAAALLVAAAGMLAASGHPAWQAACFVLALFLIVSAIAVLANRLTASGVLSKFPRASVVGIGAYPLVATLTIFLVQ